jgi:hypothetical protein
VARGNPYLETLLQLRPGAMTRLAADDPKGARRQAEEALRRWSRAGFHVQHYQERIVQCNVDMLEGRELIAKSNEYMCQERIRCSRANGGALRSGI